MVGVFPDNVFRREETGRWTERATSVCTARYLGRGLAPAPSPLEVKEIVPIFNVKNMVNFEYF